MRGLNNLKEYKIIFSDIDGTLLNNENQVPEETIEELRRLDSQGVPFVLVSARMPKGMRPIREELGIHAPMVCYSGGLVLDPDDQEISAACWIWTWHVRSKVWLQKSFRR